MCGLWVTMSKLGSRSQESHVALEGKLPSLGGEALHHGELAASLDIAAGPLADVAVDGSLLGW